MVETNLWRPNFEERRAHDEHVGNVDPEVGAFREGQLAAEFVKPALDKGAQLLRHYNTTESAHNIIRAILRNRQAALQVQQELVDEGKEFYRTTVGEGINREVEESTRKLERQVDELQNALENVRGREKETRSQMEAETAELLREIERLKNGSGNMNTDYRDRKTKAAKLWAALRTPAGASISGIVFGALCLGLRLYLRV